MSVVSIRQLFSGQSSESSLEKRTYRAAWLVETNNPSDNQTVVVNALSGRIGTPWRGFGNGTDTLATLKTLSASRVPDSRLWWIVEGTWETPDGQDNNGNSNELADNPLDWRERVERTASKHTVPVETAVLHTPLQNINRAAGSEGPVVNAAGTVFDPPPEKDSSLTIYRFVKNAKEFPADLADEYENAINSDTFTITKPGLKRTFKPLTVKLEPITGTLNYHRLQSGQEIFYWQINLELHYNKKTWRSDIVNRGPNKRGDVDDEGNMISPNEKERFNLPDEVRVTDDQGLPVGSVLLDLTGIPLKSGQPTTYIKYGFYDEKPFAKLGI